RPAGRASRCATAPGRAPARKRARRSRPPRTTPRAPARPGEGCARRDALPRPRASRPANARCAAHAARARAARRVSAPGTDSPSRPALDSALAARFVAAEAIHAQCPEHGHALAALVGRSDRGAFLPRGGEMRVALRVDLELAHDGHVGAEAIPAV